MVETLWAYLAADPAGGNERILHMDVPEFGSVPLVASDRASCENYRKIAQQIGAANGQVVKLVEFRERIDVETIMPGGRAES